MEDFEASCQKRRAVELARGETQRRKWKSVLWMLIRKESNFDQIDWASAMTLGLYGALVLLFLGVIISTDVLIELPPQG